MTYETAGALKFVEEDIYDEGCIDGPYTQSYFVDYRITATTKDAMLKSISEFTGCPVEDLQVNSCDEAGRIDAAVTESEDGMPLTDKEREQWKAGKLKAFYTVYSFYIEDVTRAPATF